MSARMWKVALFIIGIGVMIGAAMPNRDTPIPGESEMVAVGSREPVVTRVPRQRNGHFYVHALVNGHLIRFLVDTGATTVALTTEDADSIGEKISPDSFEFVGEGAGGPVRGQRLMIDSIEIEGKRVNDVRGVVLEGLGQSLLGQNYLARMGSVEMTADEMIIRPRTPAHVTG
jgi:aspartyl protease family protein